MINPRQKEEIANLFRAPAFLSFVDISKIYGVTPERISSIVREKLSMQEIADIKSERSLIRAVWSRSKNIKNVTEEIINKAMSYEIERQNLLRKD